MTDRDDQFKEIKRRLAGDPLDEMDDPGKYRDENYEHYRPPQNRHQRSEPVMQRFASLKKFVVAGSCCTGVTALFAIASWDHGMLPIPGPFALASDTQDLRVQSVALKADVNEMLVMLWAGQIRDLTAAHCKAPSRMLSDQIESLQYKYEARTGKRYPHVGCP